MRYQVGLVINYLVTVVPSVLSLLLNKGCSKQGMYGYPLGFNGFMRNDVRQWSNIVMIPCSVRERDKDIGPFAKSLGFVL